MIRIKEKAVLIEQAELYRQTLIDNNETNVSTTRIDPYLDRFYRGATNTAWWKDLKLELDKIAEEFPQWFIEDFSEKVEDPK